MELKYTTHTEVIQDYLGTHEELVEAVATGATISFFDGGFEVDTIILEQDVPVIFPESKKINYIEEDYTYYSFDEDGNEIEKTKIIMVPEYTEDFDLVYIQKTWDEYTINYKSTNDGKSLIKSTGVVGNSKNYRGKIGSNLLYLFINHFGIDNILTKSDFYSLVFKEIEE